MTAKRTSRSRDQRYRIAVIVETSSAYGRGILEGVSRFVRAHDGWSVYFRQWDLFGDVPDWLDNWRGDGIISRVASPELLAAVKKTRVPFVNLTDRYKASCPQNVRSNDDAIGRLAAEHLLERGFRKFGFCGFKDELWSDRRWDGFNQAVSDAGYPCDRYQSAWGGDQAHTWDTEQRQLQQWLTSIAPPFGVMACNDIRARQVMDACVSEGVSVPEQVAVVGVDDDKLLCQFCDPPLTSVIPNAPAIGFQAAEILSSMLRGESAPETVIVDPTGIAVRQSTDIVAIDNPDISRALKFIRDHACTGISVDDVVVNTTVSRSQLERSLRRYIGRTPQQEIRRLQISRVCELLLSTDLAAEAIAVRCGFENPEYMYVVFKRVMEMTPGQYRQSSQPR